MKRNKVSNPEIYPFETSVREQNNSRETAGAQGNPNDQLHETIGHRQTERLLWSADQCL